MKKIFALSLTILMFLGIFCGCKPQKTGEASSQVANSDISSVSAVDENSSDTSTPSKTEGSKPTVSTSDKPISSNPKGSSFPSESTNANPVSDFEYTVDKTDGYVQITNYIGTNETVIIPEKIDGYPVKYIGTAAFANYQIKYVTIPDTVKMIVGEAFCGCTQLIEVNFGRGLKEIYPEAFMGCTKLEKVMLPSGLEKIYPRAFMGCTSLKEVYIPASVEHTGSEGFALCSALTDITFEEGLKNISDYSFYGCSSLKKVTIPESIETIGAYAFSICAELENVTFLGNAPSTIDKTVFQFKYGKDGNKNLTIYYKEGSSGWDNPVFSDYTLNSY